VLLKLLQRLNISSRVKESHQQKLILFGLWFIWIRRLK
jgi:hypothetical protein